MNRYHILGASVLLPDWPVADAAFPFAALIEGSFKREPVPTATRKPHSTEDDD